MNLQLVEVLKNDVYGNHICAKKGAKIKKDDEVVREDAFAWW